MSEEDIWEYKSLRKSKQPSEKIPTSQKAKQQCIKKATSLINTKQNKKNKLLNANTGQSGLLEDKNKITQNGCMNHSAIDITTPTRNKTENNKQSPKTPPNTNEGHCPSCQMPFSILLVQTPRWHVSECLDTSGAAEKECPDGILCTSTIPSHYKRYTHYQLAQSRAWDDAVYSQAYTVLQTCSEDLKSNTSVSFNHDIVVREKITNTTNIQSDNQKSIFSNSTINGKFLKSKSVCFQDSKSPKSKSPASSQDSKSPKSKSPANSQESVKWTSLDVWLSSPSKNDQNPGLQRQERLSHSTSGLDASKPPCLPQQEADLSDCDISYSPLVSDEELNSEDKCNNSIRRLFASESKDSCMETDHLYETRQVKDYDCDTKGGTTKHKRESTKISINKDSDDQEDQVFQISAGAAYQTESAVTEEVADWSVCSSPASGLGDWDNNEFWFPKDLDKGERLSAQIKKEKDSTFHSGVLVDKSSCVNSNGAYYYSRSQKLEQTVTNNTLKVTSFAVAAQESLTSTKDTVTMPTKTPNESSPNTIPEKGLKQMDIGVFFGLKPKTKIEIDEVKLPLKTEKTNITVPVNGANPVQKKRKAERSVGDTETLPDNTSTAAARAATGSQQRWGKRFRQSSTGEEVKGKKQCPFYKKIPGTGFTVDAFQYGAIEGCSAYFLTHFHSDHYGGLTKKFRFPIYCSQITANLVQNKLRVEKEFINTLPMNTECMVNNVKVVLLDANHCPGAVLLLFCLPDGTKILHTGDFRADPSMESYPALIGQKIYSLYLDTTYCSPEYTFPPQQEAIQFAVNTAFEMVTLYPRTLVVCGTYSVGKEKVFLAIADILGCKVSMSQDKYKTMQCLESEEIRSLVTTDWHSTALHVLPMMQVNFKGLFGHLNKFSGKYDRILAFKPTGWTYSEHCNSVADIKPEIRGKVTMYGIPYSEHSSYLEMKRFVQWLKPKKIIPTVNVGNSKSRSNMEKFFSDWLRKQ